MQIKISRAATTITTVGTTMAMIVFDDLLFPEK